MAERKLNLNAPLLSARRFSSPVRVSEATKACNTEDSKSERNPVHNRHPSLEQVTEPVAVPFNWEHIPGKRKDNGGGGGIVKTEVPSVHEGSAASPRFPIRWVPAIVKNQADTRLKVPKPQLNSFSSSNNKATPIDNGNKDGDKDDEDDDYSDALESLSEMDSCSMKCSVSGMSSSSDFVKGKPSGTFSTDPQTRDFMMRRFLPAAKAMTLEQPQKKQSVPAEQQPRQIVMAVRGDKSPNVRRYEASSALVPYYPKDLESEGSEEEGDECEVESLNLPNKTCGFFPRLCFKNSVLLNPVPGMKVKSLPSLSCAATRKDKKPSKVAPIRSISPFSRKSSAKDPSPKQRPGSGAQSPKLAPVDTKPTNGSDSFNYSHDRQMAGRISPFSRRSGGLSPYRNSAPQSPFGGAGLSKEAEMFKTSKPHLYYKGGSKSQELPRPSSRRTTPERVRGESKALVCVNGNDSGSPPIPLPRTPSESWLGRTLPAVSARNSVDRAASFQNKWMDSKTSSKWETMVKSSYTHHDHVRYSEELVPHSSQHLIS